MTFFRIYIEKSRTPLYDSFLCYSSMRDEIYLIRCFSVKYRGICLGVVLYFDEPARRVKMQITRKNMRRYFTPKHLIRDLLSNLTFFNFFQ